MSKELTGRIAVVTGASSGIGASTSRLLAARGATVVVLARRQDRLDALIAEINAAGGKATAYAVDVTDPAALKTVRDRVVAEVGRPSIVFNNAGVMLPAPVDEHRTNQWQHQIDLNISALMSTIDVFHDDLVATAGSDGVADLVNTSSIAGENLYPNFAVYSASKAYVTHLSKHLRAELGPKNVRVSTIAPGIVATELQSHVTDKGAQQWLEDAARSIEFLKPEDVAETVAFLVSLPNRVNLERVVIMPTGQAS